MTTKGHPIDKVRASRDGHEFHEAWAARKALQLVMPTDALIGIAVEGLSPLDQAKVSKQTVEIADLVLYYGRIPTFEGSRKSVVLQFKYSQRNAAFRHADARKTIQKFAKAYRDHKKEYSDAAARRKLEFELITNRSVFPPLRDALLCIASRKPLRGETRRQAAQFKSACRFAGEELVEFASKVRITGMAGSLTDNKRDLSRVLVNWSAAPDARARVRLSAMKDLVRNKAGLAGNARNVITRIDVLEALELQGEEDLFPCPDSFPAIGEIVEREQLRGLAERIPTLQLPLIVHAAGGVGKTVFVQSLAKSLSTAHEVVLFDCFGGGRYRAPEDARHRPNRGLIHIVNTLACRGLCDPLLPDILNTEDLISSFRRRLQGVASTLRKASTRKQLLIFIDAIDNAAVFAAEKHEECFPKLLLESLKYNGPIEGVKFIVSCRSNRIALSKGDSQCEEFLLKPFELPETQNYLRQRIPTVSEVEIRIAQARSVGNPRILEHLVASDRGLLDPSEIENVIELDELLMQRINGALDVAKMQGYKESEINSFLAGLCVLPPPVPLTEYALANGLDYSAVESFAVDLIPLIERTNQGLMFRDEPTETLMRTKYGSDLGCLHSVARNLMAMQNNSVYAARALPGLLQKLDDDRLLFELAFDDRFPRAIRSSVGKEAIRHARLKAATVQASRKSDYDRLVQLLAELSTIAAVNQRGTQYVVENPDLVVAFKDVDANRRLFETRTTWQGTRHARLAIADALSGEPNDAFRHAVHADQWINHYAAQDDRTRGDRVGPDRQDIAAIPLCLIAQGRVSVARSYLGRWKDWYGYEVSECLFSLLEQLRTSDPSKERFVTHFLQGLTSEAGVVAGALSFLELRERDRTRLVRRLAKACSKIKAVDEAHNFYHDRTYRFEDGLFKASGIALAIGRQSDASTISIVGFRDRPPLHSFTGYFAERDVFRFIRSVVMNAAFGETLAERAILPKDLLEFCSTLDSNLTGPRFRTALTEEIERRYKTQGSESDKREISYDFKANSERFINHRLGPLLDIANKFAGVMSRPLNGSDQAFLNVLRLWTDLRNRKGSYDPDRENRFFDNLVLKILMFIVWTRSDLARTSLEVFFTRLKDFEWVSAAILIDLVAILSSRTGLHDLAGEIALRAKALIETDNNVESRANHYARLSRAMLPASKEEAMVYFRAGLEQMDAIGSGDYAFTNELLLFAAATRGDELQEKDFHTLTNICELNIPDDEEKFPWVAFAQGLSRVSGCRGLAKLGRWDDRSKISLDYTLLPYLKSLIELGKIDPAVAVALLQLTSPAEFYECDSASFAKAIRELRCDNEKVLINEVVSQFQRNHLGIFAGSVLDGLKNVVQDAFGVNAPESEYLSRASLTIENLREEQNKRTSYGHSSGRSHRMKPEGPTAAQLPKLRRLVSKTSPIDELEMSQAFDEATRSPLGRDLRAEFFAPLRAKVRYGDRLRYVQLIARLGNLEIYTKLMELKECKEKWTTSSAALGDLFSAIAVDLIQRHPLDFISNEHLSSYMLNEIADICGVSPCSLALELVKVFSQSNHYVPAAVWMRLASFACGQANASEGRSALIRLLNSNAAKLASGVGDGAWKSGLYTWAHEAEGSAGLIWLRLGSPSARDRWRASHSVRCLARVGRWDVIDSLVERMEARDASPFQAPGLSFYSLHARLWLVIALARIAVDAPSEIARYADKLRAVISDKSGRHVLFRHFASAALLKCSTAGALALSRREAKQLAVVNVSSFPISKTKRPRWDSNAGDSRSITARPKRDFLFDYDFEKYEITSLCRVFGNSEHVVQASIREAVKNLDPLLDNMYNNDGRTIPRDGYGTPRSDYDTYGRYIGWHGLHLAAGKCLSQFPVTDDSYDKNPWADWLRRYLLTRQDDLWLADGNDVQPLETRMNLLERNGSEIVITGNRQKILKTANIASDDIGEVVVEGDWRSADDVKVSVSSAMVPVDQAESLAIKLVKAEPFQCWLPTYDSSTDGNEYERNGAATPYIPWVVVPSFESRLDEYDPFGSICAGRRPFFRTEINAVMAIRKAEPFGRVWVNSGGKVAAHAEAWGREAKREREPDYMGTRLVCTPEFLSGVLAAHKTELLVLIKFERYEESLGKRAGGFSHTVGVVRLTQSLDCKFYRGAVNKLHERKY
jgi:hypothetical protein